MRCRAVGEAKKGKTTRDDGGRGVGRMNYEVDKLRGRLGLDDLLPRVPPLGPRATAGQRWRYRRNLVIYVAYRNGVSQRLLADVFDIPRSHISTILKNVRSYDPSLEFDSSLE